MGVTISGVQSYTAITTQFATNRIRQEVNTLREVVGTGERISRASDDGAAYAVAQRSRSTLAARGALIQQLETSKLVLERGLSATSLMQTAAFELKGVLTRLADSNQSPETRAQTREDYKRIVAQFYEAWAVDRAGPLDPNGLGIRSSVRDNYDYGGGLQQDVTVLAGINGEQFNIASDDARTFDIVAVYQRLTGQPLGATAVYPPPDFAPDQEQATAMLQGTATPPLISYDDVRSEVDGITAKLGSDYRGVTNRLAVERALSSELIEEIGALVDADMAKSSARLAALSAKEDLAIRQVGVANSSVDLVLGLIPR